MKRTMSALWMVVTLPSLIAAVVVGALIVVLANLPAIMPALLDILQFAARRLGF